MELQEIRNRLDVIDKQMAELFEKRMDLCAQVARIKAESGKAVYDGQREAQKLAAIGSLAEDGFARQDLEELFSQIMTMSRRMQYRILTGGERPSNLGFQAVDELKKKGARVAYQGVEGSYGHGAALQYFGDEGILYHVPAMEDAMVEVEEGREDFGVLPIENSSAGAVSNNYDLLVRHNVYIVAEIQIPVRHALLGLPKAVLSDIRRVYSHPQALMQSSKYLKANREWQLISAENTAWAAKKIWEDGDITQAAVASETAGRLYGLKTLACPINYDINNTTRFIVLSKYPVYRRDAGKVSICFECAHKSGALYNMLGNLIYNHINMLMIESRPIEGRSWEYRFFVDMEGSLGDAGMQNALAGIRAEAAALRILGNY